MEFVHCQEYDPGLVIGGSVKYADLLNKGLINIGHSTRTYHRGSIFAGKKDITILASERSNTGIFALLKEVLNSWKPTKSQKIWIVHHPAMGFFSIFARKEKLIYICHGPWSEEARDIGKEGLLSESYKPDTKNITVYPYRKIR